MTVSFLKIYASNVSAFAGRHKYKKQAEAFVDTLHCNHHLKSVIESALDNEELFYKPVADKLEIVVASGETATAAVQRLCSHHEQTKEEVDTLLVNARTASGDDIAKLRLKRPRTEDIERKAISSLRETTVFNQVGQSTSVTSDMKKTISDTVQNIAGQLGTPSVERVLTKTLYCERGNCLESDTLGRLSELVPEITEASTRKEQYFVELNLTIDHTNVLVAGVVDLAVKNEHGEWCVVEVKNRVNRFFTPNYDLDQLALYVVALQAKSGYLAQQCNGKIIVSPEMTLCEAQKRYETSILPDLQKAVKLFVQAVDNPFLPEHYCTWSLLRVVK